MNSSILYMQMLRIEDALYLNEAPPSIRLTIRYTGRQLLKIQNSNNIKFKHKKQ